MPDVMTDLGAEECRSAPFPCEACTSCWETGHQWTTLGLQTGHLLAMASNLLAMFIHRLHGRKRNGLKNDVGPVSNSPVQDRPVCGKAWSTPALELVVHGYRADRTLSDRASIRKKPYHQGHAQAGPEEMSREEISWGGDSVGQTKAHGPRSNRSTCT